MALRINAQGIWVGATLVAPGPASRDPTRGLECANISLSLYPVRIVQQEMVSGILQRFGNGCEGMRYNFKEF
jgi:hypothetical protein